MKKIFEILMNSLDSVYGLLTDMTDNRIWRRNKIGKRMVFQS